MKFFAAFLLCTALVFIAGCSDDNAEEPEEVVEDICANCLQPSTEQELIPLTVGNWWEYSYSRYDTLGNAVVTDSVVNVWVEKTYPAAEREVAVLGYRSMGSQSYSYVHACNSAEGFCVGHIFNDNPKRYLYRLYKYPTQLEVRYFNTDKDTPLFGSWDFWLESESESIATSPLGTFDCLYYFGYPVGCSTGGRSVRFSAPMAPLWGCDSIPGLSGDEHLWFKHYVSPGVGVIKQVTYTVTDTVRVVQEWELTSYHLE